MGKFLTVVPAVDDSLDRMKVPLADAKTKLTVAQEQAKRQMVLSHGIRDYVVGDEVLLSTKHLKTYAQHLPLKLKHH